MKIKKEHSSTWKNYIQFNTLWADGQNEGRLQWNFEEGTLEVGMPGGSVNLQIGQETLIRATNDQGEQIDNGKMVIISGGTGSFPNIKYADKSSIATAGAIGMATEDIATAQKGYVTNFGLVRDVDTDGIAAGMPLWLGDDGVYTSTRPTAPDISVVVGTVIRSHATEGVIFLHPQVVPRLRGLSDVYSPTTPNQGEFISWDTTNSRWQVGNAIAVPTATQEALILKTTDDNATKNLLEIKKNDDTNMLVFKSDTGRLGIGTDTPDTKLEVVDVAANPGLKFTTSEVANNWMKVFPYELRVNRATGSNAGFELRTTNSGSWGAVGGYVSLLPGNSEALRALVNGNVGINESTPGAQLHIQTSGTTVIGQIIRATASQTANLTEWQNSSSAVKATVGPNGEFTAGTGSLFNNTQFRTVYSVTDGTSGDVHQFVTALTPASTISGASFPFGLASRTTTTLGSGIDAVSTESASGYFQNVANVATGQTLGTVDGIGGQIVASGDGTVTNGFGLKFFVSNTGTGTITHGYGSNVSFQNTSTGTITNAYGYRVTFSAGSGTITNAYGVNIPSVTAGSTLNYAIFTNAGNVSIGDELETRAGRIVNTTRVTTTYTALVSDHVVVGNTDGGNFTVTLPAGSSGQTLRIINSGTGILSITPDGVENLLGANSSFDLSENEALLITYESTDGWL